MSEKGSVYIATNKSFKDDIIKIGMSKGPAKDRLKDLDSTPVPTPFECYAELKTDNYEIIERLVHEHFNSSRIRGNREFFNVNPEKVYNFFSDLTKIVPNCELNRYYRPEEYFLGDTYIPIGATLHFSKDDSITCKVVSINQVEYNGKIWSLSGLSDELNHKKCGHGRRYWKYKGVPVEKCVWQK